MPDFNIPGWLKSLELYEKFDVDTIVFSHNGNFDDPLETGDLQTIRDQIKFLEDLRDAVRSELAAGKHPFVIFNELKLPKYKNLVHYDDWFGFNVQGMVVSEFLGPIGWKPVQLPKPSAITLNKSAAKQAENEVEEEHSSGCYLKIKKLLALKLGK